MIKNERGFTLIEMLIVLLIISALLILTIPNISKYNNIVEEKGCAAYEDLLQTEVQLYKIEYQQFPADLNDLDSVNNTEENTCINENSSIIDGVVNLGS